MTRWLYSIGGVRVRYSARILAVTGFDIYQMRELPCDEDFIVIDHQDFPKFEVVQDIEEIKLAAKNLDFPPPIGKVAMSSCV